MTSKKSDTRRFFETMWVIVKYDVLPWVLVAGMSAALAFSIIDAQGKIDKDKVVKTFFQKER